MFINKNMSLNVSCRLCCTTCIDEYHYLQNDSGECNEIYEITVKYFDPMLLAELINTTCTNKNSVLCQNCWVHIKDFHNFQQTVITTRSSLDQINLQKSPLQINEEYDSSVLNNSSDFTGNEEIVQSNKLLINDLVDDLEMLSDEDDDTPLNKLTKAHISLTTINNNYNKVQSKETNDLLKKVKPGKKRMSKFCSKVDKSLYSDIEVRNDDIVQRKCSFKDSSKNTGFHPVLDKGKEYDKFIAEWKSQLECDICNEAFPIFDLLKAHFKDKHNARGFVKCCDRKFDRRCSLVEHIRLHINPEMHKCDICGKLSGSKYSLIHHKKTIHEESQKFKCNECPKIFKQKQNLKCHLLTHVTGNRDFKCTECDKAYVLELQLKKHIKLVHIDNRICDQCGKTLHGIGALKNHLKEHDGIEKPKYPCEDCGAELGSRITLKRHKASYHNDGSTVYICSLCGKASSTERALKNHKKYVHEIERKYKCPHCDKAFKRSQNLQEHIATHTGEALYQCPQCPRSFKINSKYHEHRKKAHPIEWEAGRKNRIEKQKIDYKRVKNQVVL